MTPSLHMCKFITFKSALISSIQFLMFSILILKRKSFINISFFILILLIILVFFLVLFYFISLSSSSLFLLFFFVPSFHSSFRGFPLFHLVIFFFNFFFLLFFGTCSVLNTTLPICYPDFHVCMFAICGIGFGDGVQFYSSLSLFFFFNFFFLTLRLLSPLIPPHLSLLYVLVFALFLF